ncbi:MAG: ABC transporter substrate-binding protein [Terriglobales bacterium]
MKPLLAAILLLVSSASAETRPRYGGTLRVEIRTALQSLDPATPAQDPGFAQIAPLVYDTLVRLDAGGHPIPALALSWQQEGDFRWRFTLRNAVRFSDGTALAPAVAAQSLHEANPDWNLRVVGDVVIIESGQPLANLPAMLALSRNSIVLRNAGGNPLGTGPFRVSDFQPGRRLTLAAVEENWQGRPFLDAIDIQLNRGARDQMVDFELNRVDVAEVATDQLSRLGQSGRRVFTSDPVDLLALRFSHSNVRDARVREAIALTVDRDSIYSVLLQRRGEPTGALLPNWITGYSFLFASAPQVARARQLRAEARQTAPLTLVYDAADPLARLVAERVAVNANDAGITLKTLPSTQNITVPDIELMRVRLASTDPAVALSEIARTDRLALTTGETVDRQPSTAGGVYRATVSALKDHWAIPIAYLPAAYVLGARVRNWMRTRDASWQLQDVWLGAESLAPVIGATRP